MIYVALLRGINVGGNAKVEMSKLKTIFEKIGCEKVSTYINSGNVIFSDNRSEETLNRLVNTVIKQQLEMDIPVLVRSALNIKSICEEIPLSWANDEGQKTDVLFLWNEIDNKDIFNKIVINPKLEKVKYLPGALVWNIGRENATKSNSIKLVKSDLYKHMTARNINTVRKLGELLNSISE